MGDADYRRDRLSPSRQTISVEVYGPAAIAKKRGAAQNHDRTQRMLQRNGIVVDIQHYTVITVDYRHTLI